MGNISDVVNVNKFDSNILMGQTMDEANSFIKNNRVYLNKTGTNIMNDRITEVCIENLKERDEPGRMRLNVETNSYGIITKILYLG